MGVNSVSECEAVAVAEQEQPVPLAEFYPKWYKTGRFLGSFGRKDPQQRTCWVVKGKTVISEEDSVHGKYQVGICTYTEK